MADKKISELDAITGADTAADDFFIVVDSSGSATKKISRAELNNAIERDVLDTVDINGGTIDGTTIGASSAAAGSFTTLQADTSLNVDGTVTADGLTVGAGDQIKFGGTAFDYIAHDSSNNAGIINHRNTIKVNVDANNDSSTDGYFGVGRDGTDASSTDMFRVAQNGDISFYDDTGVTQGFFWDASAESLGIGTTSPSSVLHLSTSNDPKITLTDTGFGASADITGSNGNLRLNSTTATLFDMADSEAARIDSSGNLLVGKTSIGVTTEGFEVRPSGIVAANRDGANAAYFGRLTDDGDIVKFYKDGSAVGSIGAFSSQTYYAGSDSGLRFYVGGFLPCSDTGAAEDNTQDIGLLTVRYDDIYATNGTIQTSDANEKQQIAALTDAEMTAAKAISALFKTFKWNDKVEAKGDAARTHTGVIAQDVEAAMTDAGLDAGDYAFFISTDWYVDADGNEVEADAEGAIAKNRKGIRYPELLSFVGAATEQRLANIETRLVALEAK